MLDKFLYEWSTEKNWWAFRSNIKHERAVKEQQKKKATVTSDSKVVEVDFGKK